MRLTRLTGATVAALLVGSLAACGGGATDEASDDDALLIYSGRSEELVGPLLERLEGAVGTKVEVRYADSAELAAQLLEEGERTDADLFFSQDAGALGALGRNGRLADLPEETLALVGEEFRDTNGQWVATSARARVVVHHQELAPEVTGFESIDDVLDEAYAGKIGYAPTNASFQSFVTALRVMRGEDAAEQWLTDFAALDPVAYEKNGAVLEAVNSGEVALGLINHYYWYPMADELGADAMNARVHFLNSDDPGALINVAGAGVLAGSEQEEAARSAVDFLLSEEAQQYFADQTAEFPVIEGVSSAVHETGSLADISGARLDLNDLDSLEETQALLEKVGLI